MAKSDENALIEELQVHLGGAACKLMSQLLALKYERYKETLVASDQDLTRGRAQEVRDLRRVFCRDGLTNA